MGNKADWGLFLDEVRDDFFVPGMMKRVWKDLLTDYKVLEEQIEEVGGKAYVTFGTLLGAIRYGGFIPWDDDIDIEMKRRYMNPLKDKSDRGELPGEHRVEDYRTNHDDNLVRKWVDTPRPIREEKEWEKHFGFPYQSTIDIFPLDELPSDEQERAFYIEIIKNLAYLKTVSGMIERRQAGEPTDGVLDERAYEDRIRTVERLLEIKFDRSSNIPLSIQMLQTNDAFCDMYLDEPSDSVTSIPYFIRDGVHVFPNKLYDRTIAMPIEGIEVTVPVGYDSIMRSFFGNYMKPVHIFYGHAYPYYRPIADEIREKYGVELERYTPGENEIGFFRNAIGREVITEKQRKTEVVFVVYRVQGWKSLHTLWEAVKSDENAIVTVIPAPWYYRDYNRNVIKDDVQYETDGFPEEVELTAYDSYDMEKHRPDIVITQCPYDGYSDGFTIHPYFYAENLIRYTDRLVMIPDFTVREIVDADARSRMALKSYIESPGMIYSTDIIVQSEGMKKVYEEMLQSFISDSIRAKGISDILENDIKSYLSDKISGIGSPLTDFDLRTRVLFVSAETGKVYDRSGAETLATYYDDCVYMPEEWLGSIRKEDGSFRRILVFFISGSMLLEQGEKALQKAAEVLDIFDEYREDLAIMWLVDPWAKEILDGYDDVLLDKYIKMYDEFESSSRGMVAELGGNIPEDSMDIAKMADGFYGDGCIAMNECRMRHLPVLMEWYRDDIHIPENYEYKKWDDRMTIEDEGVWGIENFAEEVIRYKKEKPIGDNGKKIWNYLKTGKENERILSVCIITKNESGKLRKCLEALKPCGFEIVVVDTGSDDDTIEMASGYTDSIYEFEWIGDFAKAKNFAVSKAKYDTVMVVDSDEYFLEGDLDSFVGKAVLYPEAIGQIRQKQFTPDENGKLQENTIGLARVFDRRSFHYAGCIHEQLVRGGVFDKDRDDSREMLERRKSDYIEGYDTGLLFMHDGYAGDENERRRKA
ncbi:MAG: LicD family protein, partial [Eubacterium sp.]|nr:LicD family protein [Eubacterium sp.]